MITKEMGKTVKSPDKKFPIDIFSVIKQAIYLFRKYFWVTILVALIIPLLTNLTEYFLPKDVFKVLSFPLSLILIIITPITHAILVLYINGRENGSKTTIGNAINKLKPRLVPVIITNILFVVIILFGLLLLVIPGIYFFIIFSQAFYIALFEGKKPLESLSGSDKLTKGNRSAIFKLGILMAILEFSAAFLFPSSLPLVKSLLIAIFSGSFGLLIYYSLWRHLNEAQNKA